MSGRFLILPGGGHAGRALWRAAHQAASDDARPGRNRSETNARLQCSSAWAQIDAGTALDAHSCHKGSVS
jgi:hypothetical protein